MESKKYTLTIYDRRTKQRLGELKSHFSVLPFFVSDSAGDHESARTANEQTKVLFNGVAESWAFDLKTGLEVWALDLPKIAYSGFFPP